MIIDFRFADVNDLYDEDFIQPGIWSRPYEYKYCLDKIKLMIPEGCTNFKIHNSAWGFEGVHILFKNKLNELGECVHSDKFIKENDKTTVYYDITKECPEYNEMFDCVLNVSTLEHLNSTDLMLKSIDNLYKQVKYGGYLILTFDYPRVDLIKLEEYIGEKCKDVTNRLNGENSICSNINYSNLNVIYFIIKK